MKAMKILMLTILVTGGIVAGCKQSGEGKEATGQPIETDEIGILRKEVLDIHDEAMLKMNDIHRMRRSLRGRLDSAGVTEEQKARIGALLAGLDSAHNGMMVWMREFYRNEDTTASEMRREFLENEMEKIKRVREDINLAIERARKSP